MKRLSLWPLLLLLLVSCKPGHKLARGGPAITDPAALLAKALSTDPQFTHAMIKGKATISLPSLNETATYRINIENGKQIWVSVGKVGIEGGRMLITRDSIRFRKSIPGQPKQHFVTDFGWLSQQLGFPVDFDMLQDILLAEARLAQGAEVATDLTSRPQGTDGQTIYARNLEQPSGTMRAALVRAFFFLDPRLAKLTAIVAEHPGSNARTSIFYREYQVVGTNRLPYLAVAEFQGAQSGRLELKHSAVEFDPAETPSYRYSVSSDYARIPPPAFTR